MARLAIDKDFLDDYSRLPKPIQSSVKTAIDKFAEHVHAGLHLEKITRCKDDRIRTIRIDQSHDEFTIDIPENQILRTACQRMLSVPRVDPESLRMLRRLLRDFGDVTVIPRGSPVPLWEPTRLNVRYHAALRLASLVLDATSIEHEAGNVAVNGFLLDMPWLFERFVTVALREAITARFGGRVEDQVRYFLDQGRQVPLRPDIVWKVGGMAAAVIDAKYKAEKPAGYPNADLYQLLAYCTILGLPVGHLVYARGNASAARHVVRQSGIEILCHAIDLDQPPEQLMEQMNDLAEVVTAMAATSCRYPV
jgi:5-methylcytosine-specific restriction enzyme subunit McrC